MKLITVTCFRRPRWKWEFTTHLLLPVLFVSRPSLSFLRQSIRLFVSRALKHHRPWLHVHLSHKDPERHNQFSSPTRTKADHHRHLLEVVIKFPREGKSCRYFPTWLLSTLVQHICQTASTRVTAWSCFTSMPPQQLGKVAFQACNYPLDHRLQGETPALCSPSFQAQDLPQSPLRAANPPPPTQPSDMSQPQLRSCFNRRSSKISVRT